MSAKVTIKTSMKDPDTVVEALVRLGVPKELIQVNPAGTKMSGYAGRNWGKVEILVPKSVYGTHADLGITRKQGEQNYSVLVDHMDDPVLGNRLTKQKATFSGLVNQWYAAVVADRTLKQQGFRTTVRQDGDRVRVSAVQY